MIDLVQGHLIYKINRILTKLVVDQITDKVALFALLPKSDFRYEFL